MPVVSLDRDPIAAGHAQENVRLKATVRTLEDLLRQTHANHKKEMAQAQARIRQLEGEVAELKATVAVLLARLNGTDPNLSSNPPSSVIPAKRRYPKKDKSTHRPGRARGTKGTVVPFSEEPDEVVHHRPALCSQGHAITESREVEARQVRDMVVSTVTTEHRVYEGCCALCGQTVRASFPGHVTARSVWGEGVKTFALLLTQRALLPTKSAADVLTALGQPVSPRCLDHWRRDLASVIGRQFSPALRASLLSRPFLCVDETPLNVKGGAGYAHVATDGHLVAYHLAGRDIASILSGGILGDYPGVAVHDHYSPYFSDKVAINDHQLCVAHLRRELKLVTQNFEPSDGRAHPQPWAKEMCDLLGRCVKERPSVTSVRRDYQRLARSGRSGTRPDTKQPVERDAWNLADRLRRHEHNVLRFLTKEGRTLNLPPTNNAAEQAVKPIKVRQRRSGCFRTESGAKEFLCVQSYLRSAVGSGVEVMDALRQAVGGAPWIPAL